MPTIGLWKSIQARQEPSFSEDGAALRGEPCNRKNLTLMTAFSCVIKAITASALNGCNRVSFDPVGY